MLRCDEQEFGLVVDCVNDSEEIVVKPRSAQLRDLAIYCGCTIMGDGKVALILDVAGIARAGGVIRDRFEECADVVDSLSDSTAWPLMSLLVATVGEGQRIAVPLDTVDRLEEFDRSSVEYAYGQQVVQYRGSLLPLIDVGATLGRGVGDDRSILQVVVCTVRGTLVGLVVCHVLDIVEHAAEQAHAATDAASSARDRSAVIQGRVTDLIRVDDLYSLSGLSSEQWAVAKQEGSYV